MLLDDEGCKRLRDEIRASAEWRNVVERCTFQGQTQNVLIGTDVLPTLVRPITPSMVGGFVGVRVSRKWYAGIIVSVDSHHVAFFLINHVDFDRIMDLKHAKGKFKLLGVE